VYNFVLGHMFLSETLLSFLKQRSSRRFRYYRLRFRVKITTRDDNDDDDDGKSGVCTGYEWRQCAVTSMREACVRLVTHRLPAPGVFTPE